MTGHQRNTGSATAGWLSMAAFLAVSATHTGSAATLVNFQGVDIPGSTAFQGYDYINGATRRVDFNLNQSLFSGSTDPDMQFVGGFEATYVNVNPVLRANDSGYAPNQFLANSDGGAGNSSYMTANLLWTSGGGRFIFTNGAANSLSLNILSLAVTYNLRFVIQDSGNFYLSQAAAAGNGLFTLSDFSGSATQWGLFNPTATDFGIPDAAPAYSSVLFTNVTAVGFVYEGSRVQYGQTFAFDQFTVMGDSMSSVPEPGTMMQLLLSGLVLYSIRKRL